MKKFIQKFNDYRYRKRLKKYVSVNLRLIIRKLNRFLRSERLRRALVSTYALVSYAAVLIMSLTVTVCLLFVKYGASYFDSDSRILRRLTMTEYNTSVPYLNALSALGCTNRIQVTLQTAKENYINPRGVGLDKGGINITLTFSDGNTTEFSLNNIRYDNFESEMTDTFTLLLPFGYTPFDITEYKLSILPDINNRYDNWHCRWARVYTLIGGKPVMLSKESWSDFAVFGDGEGCIKQSILEIAHEHNNSYNNTKTLYSYYLTLAGRGMTDFKPDDLKNDVLDMFGLNGARYLYADIETATLENQSEDLTYYTKGVDIPELDSLDYDGLIYLDVTFYCATGDGMYTKSYLLDTLGTDDFELGATSTFKLEMPDGMCVFDIRDISIHADNPHDSWAPRFMRLYVKPDYCDMLEIARLNDVMLIKDYATPVFYKNLIDMPIPFDLSEKQCVSSAVRRKIEQEKGFVFGENTAKMYFDSMSFYERQMMFFDRMCKLYSGDVYESAEQTPTY